MTSALLERVADTLEEQADPPYLKGIRDWRDSSCIDPERYPSADIAPRWEGPGQLCHSCSTCRPEQRTPTGDWDVWLYLGGRGTGKTRSAAEVVAEALAMNFRWRIGAIAPTYADARDTMIEGESGLLSVFDRWGWAEGREYIWNRSLGELKVKATRSRVKLFSAEKPARLRGPQHHLVWVDELAQVVRDAPDAWDMMLFGLRLGKHPQAIATTTPLPVQVIKDLLVDPRAAVTRGKTDDNAANLPEMTLRELHRKYDGRRLGRQELDAELLDDVPGALWRRSWIEDRRIPCDVVVKWPDENSEVTAPAAREILDHLDSLGVALIRIVVAVDPAVTTGEDSDETGIVVVGKSAAGHYYVLADYTVRDTPAFAIRKVIQAYDDWDANAVIVEVNNGGKYIPGMIELSCSIANHPLIPTEEVRAKKAKRVRAEPVSAVYEQGRAHHVGTHAHLEDQMCVWEASSPESPDRLDGLVYGVLYFDDQGVAQTVMSRTASLPQIPRHRFARR